MSVLINDKKSLQDFLCDGVERDQFTLDELRGYAKKYNCIIITDNTTCDVESNTHYKIIAFYRQVDLIHVMMERHDFRQVDGKCGRPGNGEVVCFTGSRKTDFREKNKDIILVAVGDVIEKKAEN